MPSRFNPSPNGSSTDADSSPQVWGLIDHIVGSANQTRGVMTALGLPAMEMPVAYAPESPWDRFRKRVALTPDTRSRVLAAPAPCVIVSSGRRAGAAARWIAQALQDRDGGPRPHLVHIQDPRVGHDAFDLIAVPNHDRALARLRTRDNVIVTLGAPHGLTSDRLADAARQWEDTLRQDTLAADLPRPWIAVLVGGDSGRRRLDHAVAARLARQAGELASRAGGSLLVTTSRRTRADAVAALRDGVASLPHVFYAWTPDGTQNPYLGFLGLADAVIVTGDSMSMLTEATTRGGPVYVFSPPGWARAPHARFHAALIAAGAARPLTDDTPWTPWVGRAVNPAAEIAAALRTRLGPALPSPAVRQE